MRNVGVSDPMRRMRREGPYATKWLFRMRRPRRDGRGKDSMCFANSPSTSRELKDRSSSSTLPSLLTKQAAMLSHVLVEPSYGKIVDILRAWPITL